MERKEEEEEERLKVSFVGMERNDEIGFPSETTATETATATAGEFIQMKYQAPALLLFIHSYFH